MVDVDVRSVPQHLETFSKCVVYFPIVRHAAHTPPWPLGLPTGVQVQVPEPSILLS